MNVCICKAASEEMLMKAREMYAELSIRYQDVAARVTSLEDQGTLIQAKYEACLQKNNMVCSQLLKNS